MTLKEKKDYNLKKRKMTFEREERRHLKPPEAPVLADEAHEVELDPLALRHGHQPRAVLVVSVVGWGKKGKFHFCQL